MEEYLEFKDLKVNDQLILDVKPKQYPLTITFIGNTVLVYKQINRGNTINEDVLYKKDIYKYKRHKIYEGRWVLSDYNYPDDCCISDKLLTKEEAEDLNYQGILLIPWTKRLRS